MFQHYILFLNFMIAISHTIILDLITTVDAIYKTHGFKAVTY